LLLLEVRVVIRCFEFIKVKLHIIEKYGTRRHGLQLPTTKQYYCDLRLFEAAQACASMYSGDLYKNHNTSHRTACVYTLTAQAVLFFLALLTTAAQHTAERLAWCSFAGI
jgi:hypothetical protein